MFCSKIGAHCWRVLGPFADYPGFAVKADLQNTKEKDQFLNISTNDY